MRAVRIGLGVVAGYVVMATTVFVGVVAMWSILGAEGAFQAGLTEASTPWSVMSCVSGLIASVMGGLVAATVAKQKTQVAVLLLASFVLVLGLAMAFIQLGSAPSPLPVGKVAADLTFFEAGEIASSPAWYNFTIPWIGALGVVLGGNLGIFTKH